MHLNNNNSQEIIANSNQHQNPNYQLIFIQRVKKLVEWFKKQQNYQPNQKKECPPYDPRQNYYQEFWRTYIHNQMVIQQIKILTQQNKRAAEQIQELYELYDMIYQNDSIKKKRKNRRPAIQIAKNFRCPYENCYKIYGSDVSMNLHIKIKHDGGNKTERQKLAKQIIIAQRSNQPLPQIIINFPPNYVQQYRLQMQLDQANGCFPR